MSGPYDRCEIFRSQVPKPPPSKQASAIKAQFDSVKNVAEDIAAAVKANLTLPKAMPQLPPGVAISMAKPSPVVNNQLSGQAVPMVVPLQLPAPQLKNKALEEPPAPRQLPENARQPLHQHKMHEKQSKWDDVLKGIKEHIDGGHQLSLSKLAAMRDPDGDSDEESVPLPQPQDFNAEGADDDVIFGFDAVDAKQNAKTVQTYKTAYLARCVSLMKKLGKSTKRVNCTPAALEMLFKAFHLCGDFKKSKPAYFSHVKCYIERARWLSMEEQKAYSRFFKILLQNKANTQSPGQEEGFRVSHMILKCYGIKESVDTATYRCCCAYTPYLDMPLCPVHCIDEANFKYVQRVMNQEAWRKCLRIILHNAGFPLYTRDGRQLLNIYGYRVGAAQSARDSGTDRMQIMRGVGADVQAAIDLAAAQAAAAGVAGAMAAANPMMEQLQQQQHFLQMQGAGTATDAQRDHINVVNADIISESHCDDGQCLQMSRAMDARDLLRCASDKSILTAGWNPYKFFGAMACVGFLTVAQANNMIATVTGAILGSLDSKGLVRAAIPFEKVFKIVWRTMRIILASSRLVPSERTRAAPVAPAVLGVFNETEIERYTRRVSLTMMANFHMKFDHEIELHSRELLLKAEVAQETASVRAESERLRSEMRNLKNNNRNTGNGGNGNKNQNQNKNKKKGETDDDKDRGGVLGKYMKPGEKRASPFRQNPKDRIVCWKWVKGCCGPLTADGKCPEGLGRHGGSSRRIQRVNVEKNCGLTEEEEYGAGSVLPECVRDCIRFTSDSGLEELMAKSRYVARMMLRVHEDLYELEKLEHMQLPQHLAQLYKDKCFLFMERLALWAINDSPELLSRKDEILSIFAKMKRGLSTRGEISPSGFWRLLPESQQAANERESEEEAQRQKFRKPYDHWASEEQIDEMLRQTEKNISKGIWRVLNISHDDVEAKKVFPVEQGNKTRLCCDFRMRNLMLYALEKMRMLGVRATQEVMARCMSPFADQCSLTAFKSDLKADVETEKHNREATKQSAQDEAVARYKADFDFLASAAQKLENKIEETALGGDSFSFIPFSTDAELISLYLSLAGWPETVEKSESHDRQRQRSLVVLGIAYELGPDARWISMSVDPTRIEKLLHMGKTLRLQLAAKKVELELLDSFKGLFRHVAQLVPTFNHLVRGLDCWTAEEYFQAHIRCEKERRALGALIGLLLSCVPFAQRVKACPSFFDMPIAHVYSDAAVENVKELSSLLKKGVRAGFERFKMKIGALLVKPDGDTESCLQFI
eukprot:g18989.t1